MYLDTCILIKLLVAEPDSPVFQNAVTGRQISSSELAFSEVAAALLSKERAGRISPGQRLQAWQLFQNWTDEEVIELELLETRTLRNANRILSATHPVVALRTLDAIHLSACDLSQDFPLCTTDRRMREAAELLKMPIFPETLSPA
ncbi:MAG: type II toxin-antitoxin system VapC family toxin [Terrimicrobiaceae bacterium]|nr:type II toxin-antitoxin system VapC family toxin [Terrimicrobiaceae bacterium]